MSDLSELVRHFIGKMEESVQTVFQNEIHVAYYTDTVDFRSLWVSECLPVCLSQQHSEGTFVLPYELEMST